MKNLFFAFRDKSGRASPARRWSVRAVAVAAVMIVFSLGYGLIGTETGRCLAQTISYYPGGQTVGVAGGFCGWTCCKGCPSDPCEPAGTASTTAQAVQTAVRLALSNLAITSEVFMGFVVDSMMSALLERIHTMESNMIEWWKTMWYYNLRPAMQAQTEQLNVAMLEQSKNMQAAFDVDIANDTQRRQSLEERATYKDVAGENGCPAATMAGGLARSQEMGRAMRGAWQMESLSSGSNREPESGSDMSNVRGEAAISKRENDVFQNYFCNPEDNGGDNVCGAADPAFYNADTRVTEFLYNKDTIPVGNSGGGEKYKLAVQQQIENMTGSTKMDPVPPRVLDTPQGQESWVDRRSYLARHAALSSVPQLSASWRMPGSGVGTWSKEVREAANVPASNVSATNPSYREVMKASTLDRFNSGSYATTQIEDTNEAEREKLRLSVQYLMLLRDYNDLLERVALTLSVQVAMMAEDVKMPLVPRKPR